MTLRLAACAVGVLAIAVPAVWLGGRSTAAPVPATPMPGRVLLSSSPPGSSVFIDGTESGKTPLTATLPAGRHTVEYRYRKNIRKFELTVLAGEDVSNAVDWTKKPLAPKRARPAPRTPEPEAGSGQPPESDPKPEGSPLKPEASGVAPEASLEKPEAPGPPEAIGSKPEAESGEPVHQ